MRGGNFVSVVFLSAVATLCTAQPGLARHHATAQPVNSDPCAAPHAYVKDRIGRIKVLQTSAPKTNSSLLDVLGGPSSFDTKTSIEISELRHDADGVNALLLAGGCQAFDLDRELSTVTK